jgi:hypothetical protein
MYLFVERGKITILHNFLLRPHSYIKMLVQVRVDNWAYVDTAFVTQNDSENNALRLARSRIYIYIYIYQSALPEGCSTGTNTVTPHNSFAY